MHPWYKSDKPGIAPDCGMKLVAVYEGDEQQYAARQNGTVQVSPEKQQLIGVEYGTAEYETVGDTIRAAARVTLDETRIAKVQTRLEGWIDQVFADFTGKYVQQGRTAAHHLQPGRAGHRAGVSAGRQGAAPDARRRHAGNGGQHRQPGGRRAQAPGAVGHFRRPRSMRSPAPARPSRTSR